MVLRATLRRQGERTASGWRYAALWLRRRLPTGLYARSLLIVVLPMVLLQAVVAFVFMERHWQMVTERLSTAVTRDIGAVIDLIGLYPEEKDVNQVIRIARERLGLTVSIEPGGELPAPRRKQFFSILDEILSDEIRQQIHLPFWIDTVGDSRLVEIRIQLEGKILRVFARRTQTYASNTHIFILWMVGASLVLIVISILFLRGQIRPILTLARAAESFGKGQKSPDFSPRGADEVRRAGLAFILMRERIERQIEQRTAMLTGVSHDLRTILTRFRLQLALAGDNPDLQGMSEDVEDMQSMLEGYMAFARSENEEEMLGTLNLGNLFEKLQADAEMHGKTLNWRMEGDEEVNVRPVAFSRLVTNLASNARRYAGHLEIEARHSARWLTITLDDDGPGIPESARDDVFKPFFRLDEARNLDASGTGLGLAIARDIARSHGGDITLADSPLGGLRAIVRVPA